jgi:hypothetical protein
MKAVMVGGIVTTDKQRAITTTFKKNNLPVGATLVVPSYEWSDTRPVPTPNH